MGLFFKKKPNDGRITEFWSWFEGESHSIAAMLESENKRQLPEYILPHLMRAFPGQRGIVGFNLGGSGEKLELNLFDDGNKYVRSVCARMAELMPESLRQSWAFQVYGSLEDMLGQKNLRLKEFNTKQCWHKHI